MIKNQTSSKYRNLTDNYGNPRKGIGICAKKDPITDKAIRYIEKDITYPQLLRKTKDTIAFLFIPYNSYIIIDNKKYMMTSYRDYGTIIRNTNWKCVGRCVTSDDCPSSICLCLPEGICF